MRNERELGPRGPVEARCVLALVGAEMLRNGGGGGWGVGIGGWGWWR